MRRALSTRHALAVIAVTAVTFTAAACGSEDEEGFGESGENGAVNIYSSRHYDVDKEIYEAFEEETGIKLNIVEGKNSELVERIIREKDTPQADVLLTVGAETIYQLHEADVLGDIDSETINKNVPERFRGDGWMGMTSRARVIAYAKDRVDPQEIRTYDDLTDEKWEGKVLSRSSSSSYNVALLASFVNLRGEEQAKEWAQGVANNFAHDPNGNDIDQAKEVAAGGGDLAIMNSYYYARMKNSSDPEQQKIADKVDLIFPENTQLNLSYAAVLDDAKNEDDAVKLLEYLSSADVQRLYAEENGEFPVNPAVELPEVQASWGDFTTQDLNFAEFGKDKPAAARIFDEVGWK